jgi:hypothetical protein
MPVRVVLDFFVEYHFSNPGVNALQQNFMILDHRALQHGSACWTGGHFTSP